MTTVSEILKARKPRRRSLRLVLDGEATIRLDLLKNELANLRTQERVSGKSETLSSQIPVLERRIQELEAEILATTVDLEFQAIGRRKLQELKAKYPPNEEQWMEYREVLAVNPHVDPPKFDDKAIIPELIALSSYKPEMSIEDAQSLWDELSDGEAAQVQLAVWAVNQEAATVPLSATATGGTGVSDALSTIASVMGSRGQSTTGE